VSALLSERQDNNAFQTDPPLSPFPVPDYYQVPRHRSNHQYRKALTNQPMRTSIKLHPFSAISYRKHPRPAATFDANVIQVQARCSGAGGDPAVIGLLPAVFVGGITQKALIRPLTSSEARDYHGGRTGQVYRILLRVNEDKRFYCRLCAIGDDEGGWKHAKDALRHLKRDHFGLGMQCDRWSVFFSIYERSVDEISHVVALVVSDKVACTANELKRHNCVAKT